MTTKNRKSYSARDWEDIVKIELTDAIDRKSKAAKPKESLLEDEEWDAFICEVLKTTKTGIEANSSDVCFVYNEKYYSRTHEKFGGKYAWCLGTELRRDLRIHVELLDAKTRLKVTKKLTEWLNRAVNESKACSGIQDLMDKLSNYKDLAARFRLGYTGDPADLDGIQNKCRAFLLGEGATK